MIAFPFLGMRHPPLSLWEGFFIVSGKKGLNAVSDKNNNLHEVTADMVNDVAAAIDEERAEHRARLMRRSVPESRTLKDALGAMTKQELDDIRFNLKVTGASSLKKAELVEKLAPEIIEFTHSWFPTIVDEQYILFESLCANGGLTKDAGVDEAKLEYLRCIGLLACGNLDGELAWYMPDEIQEEFKKIQGGAFKEMALLNTEMVRLVSGMLFYYGVQNYDQLYTRITALLNTEIEFFDFLGIMINSSCWYANIASGQEGMFYYTVLDTDSVEDAQRELDNVDFAPLSYARLLDAGHEGYVEKTDAYRELVQHLVKKCGKDQDAAEDVVGEITIIFENGSHHEGAALKEALEYLGDQGIISTEQQVEEACGLIIEYYNSLPLWGLKGYSPQELKTAPRVHHEPHTTAVGRNDPCPCGSGKKYKKCCYKKDWNGND